jgi:hypothetical protein
MQGWSRKGWDHVVVIVLNDVHDYASSGRRTTTPSSNWVAYRALPILMSEPDLGVKKLQKRLQEKYNVQIGQCLICMAHGRKISNNC